MNHSLLELRPSTIPGAGQGVFAKVDIPRNTTLGHYEGQRLTRAQVLARYPHGMPQYVLALASDRYIDGSVGGNILTRINAPRGTGRRSNAKVLASGRVITTVRITQGREVLMGYGAHFWRQRPTQADREDSDDVPSYPLSEIVRLPVRLVRR